ncbi:MAG TPA: transketolase [Candidatus Deferrimicrobium sp.]|nr:transketolase [Candidatus Deferrimicrobium sp.]
MGSGNNIDIPRIKKSADYIRYLALECVERANSGHPGLPLGCADLGVLLYRYILNFNTEVPLWPNRDRFILSAGHGSMLLYGLLHSVGYDLSLDDLANFRQLKSKSPGHPEYERKLGIETTTGPLGQGFANAVGVAIEGKMMAQRFNKEGYCLFDYTVYTLMGDGCNMEGLSYEAGSLAGHLGLDNLIAIYDSNHISIDGRTDITFTEDVAKRYEALGWQVDFGDSKDMESVSRKLSALKEAKGKPKLLILNTIIGEGLDKKKDTFDIHGAPAGLSEIAFFILHAATVRELFEEKYGPEAVADKKTLEEILASRIKNKKTEPLLRFAGHDEFMKERRADAETFYHEWKTRCEDYKKHYPQEHEELTQYLKFKLPDSLADKLLQYTHPKASATRVISGEVLNMCAKEIPQIVGGSADLASSTKAQVVGSAYINRDDFSGRNIAFGVREHAMAAIGNGLALNRAMIPFSSSFFTFFDYMKPSVRLAALMKLNHLFIFSHDSIYVGEDGPTHQPIEHLNSLRLLPNIHTFRPANDIETAFSYRYFFTYMNGPVALVTTRQGVSEKVMGVVPPGLSREKFFEIFQKGGYIFYETPGSPTQEPEVILCGSGSEISLALHTAQLIEKWNNKKVRLVSIPCLELLNDADLSYREQLFNRYKAPVVVIEAASYKGINFYRDMIHIIDIPFFGESAPGEKVAEYFGFTPEAVYENIARNFPSLNLVPIAHPV